VWQASQFRFRWALLSGMPVLEPVEEDRGPGGRAVAFALVPQRRVRWWDCPAAGSSAIVAAGRSSLDEAVEVAGGARNLEMTPLEREDTGLVEGAGGEVPADRIMAGLAALGHAAPVGVGVAGIAVRAVIQVGAGLVAGRAIAGERGVLAFEGEAGFGVDSVLSRVDRGLPVDSPERPLSGRPGPASGAPGNRRAGHPGRGER
jgi:hypothetical protein